MDTGTILGVVAIAVAVAVPFGIERLKRPRLEIVSSQWSPPGFVLWTFATVRIRNRPLSKVLDKLLTRQPVQGCTADIDFYHWDSDACTFTVPGRWSSAPEPLRLAPEDLPTVLPPVNPKVGAGTAPTTGASEAPLSSPRYRAAYDSRGMADLIADGQR